MPKISVIIPVYNKKKYLSKCLDSLTAQTLSDIEIICINDCSSDGSEQVLQEYAKRDSRIKEIDLAKNSGAAVARNRGLEEAQGEYLSFVDADDWVDANFYEKLYQVANGADISKGLIVVDDRGDVFEPEWQMKAVDFINNPAKFVYGFTSAIYRTDLIKQNKVRFPEEVKNLEDPYFLVWAVALAHTFAADDSVKYHYWRHEGSASANNSVDDFLFGAEKIFNLLNSLNIKKEHYLDVVDFMSHMHFIDNINSSLFLINLKISSRAMLF